MFRPSLRQGVKSVLNICIKAVDNKPNGFFRVAYSSSVTMRIPLNMASLFNNDELKPFRVGYQVRPDELKFEVRINFGQFIIQFYFFLN